MGTQQPEIDALAQLKKMVIGQKSAALPELDAGHPLQPLHQQMQAYDRFVTERVIRVLGGEKVRGDYPDAGRLRAALENAPVEEHGSLLAQYRRYQQRLDEMLHLADQAAAETP